jgi:hypothetical protein
VVDIRGSCYFCVRCRIRRALAVLLPHCGAYILRSIGQQWLVHCQRNSDADTQFGEQQRDARAETDRDADENQIICGEQWDVWFGPEDG